MKFTAQRETTIGDVEPGELIGPQNGPGPRLIIDEVRRRRDSIEVYCVTEGSESTRRLMLPFKSLDEKITVEAGAEDGAEILELLHGLLAHEHEDDPKLTVFDEGRLTMQLATRKATRVWKISIEA